MNMKALRDAIIFSAIFTVFSALASKLLKPDAKVVNEDNQTESSLRIGKKCSIATSKDGGLEVLKNFFYAVYTALNVMQTVQLFKDAKKKKNA